MTIPVGKREMGRIVGRSPATITFKCRDELAPAMIMGGQKIDLEHPAARAYLEKMGVDVETTIESYGSKTFSKSARNADKKPARKGNVAHNKPASAAKSPTPRKTESGSVSQIAPVESAPDIEEILDLTLREIVDRWGSAPEFKDWLDARKKLADIREKDLKNGESEGRLISRQLVKTHVFGAIEATSRRLLIDAPKQISRRLYGMARSGASIEEAEKVTRDAIGSQLRPMKATAVRVIKNA